jgi:hypothetical protein
VAQFSRSAFAFGSKSVPLGGEYGVDEFFRSYGVF